MFNIHVTRVSITYHIKLTRVLFFPFDSGIGYHKNEYFLLVFLDSQSQIADTMENFPGIEMYFIEQ